MNKPRKGSLSSLTSFKKTLRGIGDNNINNNQNFKTSRGENKDIITVQIKPKSANTIENKENESKAFVGNILTAGSNNQTLMTSPGRLSETVLDTQLEEISEYFIILLILNKKI